MQSANLTPGVTSEATFLSFLQANGLTGGSGGGGGGLTQSEVDARINAAIAALPKNSSGLSEEQVRHIVTDAVNAAPKGLSQAEVDARVQAIVKTLPSSGGISEEKARQIASELIQSAPKGMNQTEVDSRIQNALQNLPAGVTEDKVRELAAAEVAKVPRVTVRDNEDGTITISTPDDN
jgi:hypothetical protein